MLSENLLLTLPFFALLFILSIFSISLITEKILLFQKWRCRNKNLQNKLSTQLREGEIESLDELLKNPNCPEAQLIKKSLTFIKHELGSKSPRMASLQAPFRLTQFSKSNQEYAELNYANESEKQDEYRLELWIYNCIEEFGLQMEKHINLFHLIANVATLLGLLGTVTGMIYAFQSGALEQSTQLAQGISQALVTTAGGLVVAIPAIISQQLFQNLIGIRVSKLEQLGRDIVFFQHKNHRKNSKQQLRNLHAQAANEQFGLKEDLAKPFPKNAPPNNNNNKTTAKNTTETNLVDLTKIQNRFNNLPDSKNLQNSPAGNGPKKQSTGQSTNQDMMQSKTQRQRYQNKTNSGQNSLARKPSSENYPTPKNTQDLRRAEA